MKRAWETERLEEKEQEERWELRRNNGGSSESKIRK